MDDVALWAMRIGFLLNVTGVCVWVFGGILHLCLVGLETWK